MSDVSLAARSPLRQSAAFTIRSARLDHLLVLTAYTIAALILSFPLVTQFSDHIAGVDGDVWSYLWAMGWARVSLLNLGTNPFHTDYVFYPLGGATQLLWGTALPSFTSIPLQLVFGLVPAFNLAYLAATVLTGYGTYLLAFEVLTEDERRTTEESPPSTVHRPPSSVIRLSSFVAGLVLAFGALRLGYGLAFTNLFHTEFIPFYVLFLLRATSSRRFREAVLAGLFFAFNFYVDFQIAAFLAMLTALWFAFVIARIILDLRRRRALTSNNSALESANYTSAGDTGAGDMRRIMLHWLVMGLSAAILSLPMLVFILQDFDIEGGNYIRVYPLRYSAARSYDAFSYMLPNARSTLYQQMPAPRVEGVNSSVDADGESELSPDRQAFLGAVTSLLAVVGAWWYRRKTGFWILIVIVFALLSLGPVLHLAGRDTGIPMPFVLLNQVPIANHIRIPMRYGIMVVFGVSLLAGAGAAALLTRLRWLPVPLVALILAETAVLPYPTLAFSVPPIYDELARQPGDFTILEIPSFNWRFAARNEVYQAFHHKRILRAYTNRIAPDVADYFNLRQTPIVVRSLRVLEGAEQGELTAHEVEQDRAVLAETLTFFNLRYAVLHRDQLSGADAARIDQYLRDVMEAQVFYDEGDVVGYSLPVGEDRTEPREFDVADNAKLMYLGRGWQIEPLVEANGDKGRALRGSASQVYFGGSLFEPNQLLVTATSREPEAPVQMELNGQPLAKTAIDDAWREYAIPLTTATTPRSINQLLFRHNETSEIVISHLQLR